MDYPEKTVLHSHSIWLGLEPGEGEYWAEGEPGKLEIERTDNDEVRLGVMLRASDQEASGVYLDRRTAREAGEALLRVADAPTPYADKIRVRYRAGVPVMVHALDSSGRELAALPTVTVTSVAPAHDAGKVSLEFWALRIQHEELNP